MKLRLYRGCSGLKGDEAFRLVTSLYSVQMYFTVLLEECCIITYLLLQSTFIRKTWRSAKKDGDKSSHNFYWQNLFQLKSSSPSAKSFCLLFNHQLR